jgi:hypothetical protein
MNGFNSNTQIPTSTLSQHFGSILQCLPTSTLIISTKGSLYFINKQAVELFGCSTQEAFFEKENIKSLIVNLEYFLEMIDELKRSNKVATRNILIRRFDSTVVCANLFATLLPEDPNYVLLQLTEISAKTRILLTEMIQSLRHEAMTLNPYLNKPGKELLEKILTKTGINDAYSKQFGNQIQQEVLRESVATQLIETFPMLTNSELALCGFLSLKMTIEEIASLTGKTGNSLRVAFHRMLLKTGFATGKDFLRKLESFK